MGEAIVVPGRTVAESLQAATAVLSAAGCDTPRLDAELLLGSALGVGRERLIIDAGSELEPTAAEGFQALLARRAAREPVAYILGHKEFRHISVSVDSRVLIPRPETELLVEVGLALPAGARVADVGTGSGAVALALKDERPDLVVAGLDASEAALTVARSNAARLRLDVRFAHADLLDGAEYAAVLANLPYVADGTTLPPEIVMHEPHAAVFGGPDGLELIRRLASVVDRVPLVALEVGDGQADAVAALLSNTGFTSVERLCDLAGHERVIVARR